jgi:selenoprotein W-related protein
VEGERVWSRKEDGGFPDLPELKRMVRDRVAPSRHLGHTEKATAD